MRMVCVWQNPCLAGGWLWKAFCTISMVTSDDSWRLLCLVLGVALVEFRLP